MADDTLKPFRIPLVTLTPLLLGSAEPRGAPELRVPPFRGVLRFWLRALLGGCFGAEHHRAIKQVEDNIFGSAAGEGASSAAKLIIRLNEKDKPELKDWRAPGEIG